MIEPSFFYGAMYVNYGLTVAEAVTVFVITKLILGLGLGWCFAAILFSLFILAPYNLRLSRTLWIHMFVKYDPEAINRFKQTSK